MVTIPPKADEPTKTTTKRGDTVNDRLTKLEKVVDMLCDHSYGVNCRPAVPEDSERGDEN